MLPSQKDFYKKLLGKSGEKRAVKFLKKLGFKILCTNYKTRFGEIDVIAKDKDFTVFIEVKTRSSDVFGAPSEAVNLKKQQKYIKVASEYLLRNKLTDTPCRFDVIEIENNEIYHIINAFCM